LKRSSKSWMKAHRDQVRRSQSARKSAPPVSQGTTDI